MNILREILSRIEFSQISQASALVVASLQKEGIIHLFGTGHSSLLVQEVFYRAGGLVEVNPILDSRLSFEGGVIESTEFERSSEPAAELTYQAGLRPEDVGFVISNLGRNALPVEMALRMKSVGMQVIALTNLELSRASSSHHASGNRLFEIADVVLDNHCPPGDAAVVVSGIEHPLGPVSTIVGAVILHAVFLEATATLAGRGKPPATFVSANVSGVTLDELRRLIAPYQDRIKYYRPGGVVKRYE